MLALDGSEANKCLKVGCTQAQRTGANKRGVEGGHMPGTTTTVDTSDNLFVLGETLRPLTHQV